MASHDSALKAHRQNVKRREHNRQLRTRLRSALRDIRAAIDSEDPGEGQGRAPRHRSRSSTRWRRRGSSTATRPAATSRAWRAASQEVGRGVPERARHTRLPAQIDDQPLEQHPRIAAGTLQLEVGAEQRLDRGRHPPRVRRRPASPARTRRAVPGSCRARRPIPARAPTWRSASAVSPRWMALVTAQSSCAVSALTTSCASVESIFGFPAA